MDLFLMILKHVAWTSILIPIVLINQHVLFKKERQLKWKGIAFAWVIVVALLTVKAYFDL